MHEKCLVSVPVVDHPGRCSRNHCHFPLCRSRRRSASREELPSLFCIVACRKGKYRFKTGKNYSPKNVGQSECRRHVPSILRHLTQKQNTRSPPTRHLFTVNDLSAQNDCIQPKNLSELQDSVETYFSDPIATSTGSPRKNLSLMYTNTSSCRSFKLLLYVSLAKYSMIF